MHLIPKSHVLIYEEATHHFELNFHDELKALMEVVIATGLRDKAAGPRP